MLANHPKIRAMIPVHLFGGCADMDPLCALAAERGIAVIEDAAQSIGSEYKGRRAGSIGHMGAFSFFPSKNLGGYGDGGYDLHQRRGSRGAPDRPARSRPHRQVLSSMDRHQFAAGCSAGRRAAREIPLSGFLDRRTPAECRPIPRCTWPSRSGDLRPIRPSIRRAMSTTSS